ncbi:MAG: transcriptional antiterminator RfaH [Pseudomonadota bacterium]|jgi:transcriptional antiterminator RfaH|nr:transcriptional antiterminator RfaH [Pseudomonadota bacterium]
MSSVQPPSTRAWYLVHTKPRQEETALTNLVRQGYACYLPRMHVQKVRRGKAQVVTEAMFARYLLVQLDASGNGPSWAPIRSTLGVSQLVRFGSQYAKVDDALVAMLRQREQVEPIEPLFTPGDTVVVTHGPFAGLEAVYQMTDAQQRAMVLLHILSQPVPVKIDTASLRKAG